MASSVIRSTARQELAKRAAEFIQGTATGGSTTTVIDVNNLLYVDAYWNEQYILFTSGANNGLTRKVSAFTSASSQVTLYSAVTAVASGDTYELYRRFSPTDHNTALNAAINKSWPAFYQHRSTAVATATQDTLQYGFPTGPDLGDKGLIGIEYQRWTLASQSTFPFQMLSAQDYEVREDYSTTANASLKTLQLRFNPDTNRLIRFVFGSPIQQVATDAARITLGDPELEWLYAQSKAELWRIEANRSEAVARKDALQMIALSESEADKLKKDLGHYWPPRPIRRTRFYLGGVV
jgi:hypothetical protein